MQAVLASHKQPMRSSVTGPIDWPVKRIIFRELKVKVKYSKVYLYSFFNFDAIWGWVVKATPRPLCPRELPGTHYKEGWVVPKAGQDE